MLEAISAIITRTGALMTNAMIVAVTRSAPGNSESAKKTPQARVAPTGAENTALKTIASNAEASRTSPVLLRTNSCCCLPVPAVLMAAPHTRAARSAWRQLGQGEGNRIEHVIQEKSVYICP